VNGKCRVRILLQGAVQGVGFRPFVYQLARELHITGWVNNSSAGLTIEAESDRQTLDTFIRRLLSEKPPHAVVYSSESTFLDTAGYADFIIQKSDDREEPTTVILPDLAVCDACLKEMNDPADRRYRYPFINCTHCGPRYSIIRALPYDRPNTTMNGFTMCPDCSREYADPGDRRFHAQPIACPKCGPHLALWDRKGAILCTRNDALVESARAIKMGKIVAMKGLGGFQLIADAANSDAVAELRKRKSREEKPFAIMAKNIDMVRTLCSLSNDEERALLSPASPIVLMKQNSESHYISESVAPGNPYLGLMLPYTPLHHLLMNELDGPVVATSGNVSDEPMCIDNQDALEKLGSIADLFLVHDRPIRRYVDDSIVRIAAGREMVLRRARGFAPLPLLSRHAAAEPVLAVGGHLKNTIALHKGKTIFISQHIGDLESLPALDCFRSSIDDISDLYHMHPAAVVHDAHPDYASTHHAIQLHGTHHPVQHHIAHIASCMAEHDLDEPLLGISWDGTGFGLDGSIWGGEFISYDGKTFSRVGSFVPFPLPGGDAAAKETVRSAIGMLSVVYRHDELERENYYGLLPVYDGRLILKMIDNKINTPISSSVGRMFDAVGAILGIRKRSNFEGQTAMEVEWRAFDSDDSESYPYTIIEENPDLRRIRWDDMIRAIVAEKKRGVLVGTICRRFHNTLTAMIVSMVKKSGVKKIVLSGGCFQNSILLEATVARLTKIGCTPYWHQRIPTNDGGISAGQMYYHSLMKKSGAQ
jgi:hydrogenase maturation protein HypF